MKTNIIRFVFSAVAFALILVHLSNPNLKVDSTILGLFVASALPWMSHFIKSAKLPGGWEVEFQELKEKVQTQQDLINQLVKYSMSASIFRHLCGIAILKEYNYKDNDAFRREMYFLRDNGYIKPKIGDFIDFKAEHNGINIVLIAETTPIGMACIKLRRDEIPGDLIKDTTNIRIDLNSLIENYRAAS